MAVHTADKLRLISPQLNPRLTVEVKEESPSVRLYKQAAPLLSGIEQTMNLILTIGSYSIEPVSDIFFLQLFFLSLNLLLSCGVVRDVKAVIFE